MALPVVQAGATSTRTILYVEDDALFRITLADHLRAGGYNVVEAGNAEEAIKVLSSGSKIDLVFSDVDLPGTMGGFALAVWVRRHYRSIPVVLTSGVDSVTRPLTRQHLVPFLEKPYPPEQAERLIADVFGSSPNKRFDPTRVAARQPPLSLIGLPKRVPQMAYRRWFAEARPTRAQRPAQRSA